MVIPGASLARLFGLIVWACGNSWRFPGEAFWSLRVRVSEFVGPPWRHSWRSFSVSQCAHVGIRVASLATLLVKLFRSTCARVGIRRASLANLVKFDVNLLHSGLRWLLAVFLSNLMSI